MQDERDEWLEHWEQHFRRRFMLGRQSLTNGFEKLDALDEVVTWKNFDLTTSNRG